MTELKDGFVFALHILDSMGIDFDSDEIHRFVLEVANGRRVLRLSPEDDVQNMEHNSAMQFDEPQRSEMLSHLHEWGKDIDTKNVAIAKRIIAEIPP